MNLRILVFSMSFFLIAIKGAFAFDLEAHRGGRGLMPENTLPAFANALSIGVNTLELDLGLTKDHVLVIAHDPQPLPKLTRLNDAFIAEPAPPFFHLLYTELGRFDVGRINPDDPTFKQFSRQQPMDQVGIPRLTDLFDLVKRSENDQVRFNMEIKSSPLESEMTASPEIFADAVVKALRQSSFSKRATIQSFDWRSLLHVQKIAPDISTTYLTTGRTAVSGSPWLAGFDPAAYNNSLPRTVKAAGGGAWSPFFKTLSDEDLRTAKELKLPVIVWTVNDPNDMRNLIKRGVDGIITDYPDVLRNVMAELGLPLPKPTIVVP